MSVARIKVFSGERPRLSDRLLPNEGAQEARNVRLTNGALQPLQAPLEQDTVTTLPNGEVKSVYRLYDSDTDYWLGWLNDTDVARTPLEGDTSFRFGFTSDAFEPRISDLALATGGATYPDAWYVLGVHPPITAATVTPDASGTGTDEDRVYVYTFVTQWGEESAPSPASSITTGKDDDDWDLSNLDTAPANSYTISAASWSSNIATFTLNTVFGLRVGEYLTVAGVTPSDWDIANAKVLSISGTDVTVSMTDAPAAYTSGGTATRDAPHNTTDMKKRIYRSITTATDSNYYYVGEIDAATTTFSDTPSITIGETIPTSDWQMPPTSMQGITTLASEAVVGFSGNTVYVSEPLAMYAYPSAYRFVTNDDIVGIGSIGTAVVVVTKGFPYIINGITPETMTMERVDQFWPGTSKRSIVEAEYGVIWATNEGIAKYGIDGATLVTAEHYTQYEWQSQVNYNDFSTAYHDRRYYASYTDFDNIPTVLIFDFDDGGILQFADASADGIYSDPVTNELYITVGDVLYKWDSDPGKTLPQAWQSKTFALPNPQSMAVARISGDFGITPAQQAAQTAAEAAQQAVNTSLMVDPSDVNGAISSHSFNANSLNGSEIVPMSLVGDHGTGKLAFSLYVNGGLYYTCLVTSDTPFRLPSGFLYDDFSVRVYGSMRVDEIHIATSLTELRAG